MKKLKVTKNPTESNVLMVTKDEVIAMKKEHKSISMGNHDIDYLEKFNGDDIVGVIAGDLDNMGDEKADLWFVNIEYFNEHYSVVEGD